VTDLTNRAMQILLKNSCQRQWLEKDGCYVCRNPSHATYMFADGEQDYCNFALSHGLPETLGVITDLAYCLETMKEIADQLATEASQMEEPPESTAMATSASHMENSVARGRVIEGRQVRRMVAGLIRVSLVPEVTTQ